MGFGRGGYGLRMGYFVVTVCMVFYGAWRIGLVAWRGKGGGVKVAVILSLLDKITLFLCKVTLVKSDLGGITNGGLRLVLCGLAGSPVGKLLLNAIMATVVRSSSTAAIVIMKFMGSNVVGITRTVKVVVNTGVKADVAN